MATMATIDLAHGALLFAVIGIAYFVRGMTGFGSGLIAVPWLAHVLPMKTVVPIIMSLDFAASLYLGGIGGKKSDWSEIRILLPFAVLGALVGAFALLRLPTEPVLMTLGVFAAIFGARNLLGMQPEGAISRLWAVPTGLIGSSAGALFGIGAPPYIIYLTHRLTDKEAVRATYSWLFVADAGFRLLLFALTGLLLAKEVLLGIAVGILPLMIGLSLGHRAHVRASRDTVMRVIGATLILSGASLVLKVMLK